MFPLERVIPLTIKKNIMFTFQVSSNENPILSLERNCPAFVVIMSKVIH